MEQSMGTKPLLDRAAATAWARDHMAQAFQLLSAFDTSSNTSDIDRAVDLARAVSEEAVSAPSGTVEAKARPACLNISASILMRRFTVLQDFDDLEESIQCLHRAIKGLTDEDDLERVYYFHNLQTGLASRYKKTNDRNHLAEAVDIAQHLVNNEGLQKIDHVLSLDLLRGLCTLGFEDTDDTTYLDRAIKAGELIVRDSAPVKIWITAANELEWLLEEKFDTTKDSSYFDRSLELSRLLTTTIPQLQLGSEGTKYQYISHLNLAKKLLKCYQASNQDQDLQSAVEAHGKAIALSLESNDRMFRALLWRDLQAIFKVVYTQDASYGSLVNDNILDAVRTIESGEWPMYDDLLFGNGAGPPPEQESVDDRARREAGATWLWGVAGLFEACFRRTSVVDDIELAIMVDHRALMLAGPNHPSFGKMETSRRSRWRIWSDHVGKIPGSEIAILPMRNGDMWMPPEIVDGEGGRGLELETDAFISLTLEDGEPDS